MVVELKPDNGGGSPKRLRGAAALSNLANAKLDSKYEVKSFDELAQLYAFSWMLDQGQRETLKEKVGTFWQSASSSSSMAGPAEAVHKPAGAKLKV